MSLSKSVLKRQSCLQAPIINSTHGPNTSNTDRPNVQSAYQYDAVSPSGTSSPVSSVNNSSIPDSNVNMVAQRTNNSYSKRHPGRSVRSMSLTVPDLMPLYNGQTGNSGQLTPSTDGSPPSSPSRAASPASESSHPRFVPRSHSLDRSSANRDLKPNGEVRRPSAESLSNVNTIVRSKDTRRFSLVDAFGGSLRTLSAVGNGQQRLKRAQSKKIKRMEKKSRLVQKSGICNIIGCNVPSRDRQFLRDIFTTLIDVQWRYILLYFAIAFCTSWMAFALVYLVIAQINGDQFYFMRDSLNFTDTSEIIADPQGQQCFKNVDSILSAFLFSIETQHTIGYGHRYITTECPLAIGIMIIQCIFGLLIQSFMVGLVFAKLARAKKRAETLIFSENAIIELRNGSLCFLCRVGDMRSTHLVEAHVRMQFMKQYTTPEGEVEPLYQYELTVGENGDDRIFLVWPTTVCHKIDCNSPLYEISSSSLPTEQFEIVVVLEGIVESTGMTVQARTSYLPREVLWGHRFNKLVTYQSVNGSYQIDYSLFHSTYEVDESPKFSAKELDRRKETGQLQNYYYKSAEEAEIEESKFLECSPTPFLHSFGSSFRHRGSQVIALEDRMNKHRQSDFSMRSAGANSEHGSDKMLLQSLHETTAMSGMLRSQQPIIQPPRIVVESPSSPIPPTITESPDKCSISEYTPLIHQSNNGASNALIQNTNNAVSNFTNQSSTPAQTTVIMNGGAGTQRPYLPGLVLNFNNRSDSTMKSSTQLFDVEEETTSQANTPVTDIVTIFSNV